VININLLVEMEDLNVSNTSSADDFESALEPELERDFYGSYCLKFRIKHGTSIKEAQIYRDFGAYGELLDVWGAGFIRKTKTGEENDLKNGLDSEVHVRYYHRQDARDALNNLRSEIYHELTPAISDVLPDNHGTFTIFFDNKMGISAKDLFHEFSKYGDIKSITGDLDRLMGRVFISFWKKEGAIKAFLNKTERWFVNMRFTLPRCERDYFGTYCMKFYNMQGTPSYASEAQVQRDFERYGQVVDIRGPGLFETSGNDVYVRYWEKTSAQTALSSLVGKYDSLCITPGTDIHPDKHGMYTLTFINEPNMSKDGVWEIFQRFGDVVSVSGPFNTPTGRIFLNYDNKNDAVRAMQGMLISKQFHVRLARSCRPPKFPKSTTNHYSAVSEWNREELPRKRKSSVYERRRENSRHEEEHDRRKYFSTTEAVGRGNVKRMRHDDYERTRIDKSSLSKEQDSGPSYCYRAPYDGSGETQENVGQENDSVTDIQKTESFLQTTRI